MKEERRLWRSLKASLRGKGTKALQNQREEMLKANGTILLNCLQKKMLV